MGQVAAESFVVLLQQDELVLNKASHATVSVSILLKVFFLKKVLKIFFFIDFVQAKSVQLLFCDVKKRL